MEYEIELFTKNIFTILCSFLGSGVAGFLIFRYMPSIPLLHHLVLTASETAQSGFVIPSQPAGEDNLTGRKGMAITALHPTGKIDINGHTLDVVTDGEYIDKRRIVEIVKIRGNRIVVRVV